MLNKIKNFLNACVLSMGFIVSACSSSETLKPAEIPDWARVSLVQFVDDGRHSDGALSEITFNRQADGKFAIENHSESGGRIDAIQDSREIVATDVECRNILVDINLMATRIICSGNDKVGKRIEMTIVKTKRGDFDIKTVYAASGQKKRKPTDYLFLLDAKLQIIK